MTQLGVPFRVLGAKSMALASTKPPPADFQRAVSGSALKTTSVRELTAGDLDVVFQPIVDLQSGFTFAYEALTRCRWPEFKNPVVLFQQAEAELMRSAEELAATVSERLKAVGVDTDKLAETAREQATDLQRLIVKEIQERPLRALGLAAAVGLFVGFLSAR